MVVDLVKVASLSLSQELSILGRSHSFRFVDAFLMSLESLLSFLKNSALISINCFSNSLLLVFYLHPYSVVTLKLLLQIVIDVDFGSVSVLSEFLPVFFFLNT